MLRCIDLVKEFHTTSGTRRVLNGINCTIQRGEKWGILGRNGAGKSTLLRLIGGVDQPTSGRIELDMSVSWPLAFSGAFQGSLSGLDNLRFISRIYNRDYDEMRRFVDDFAELGQHLREPVKNYSAGMRARLAFALSIAIEFDCYLIDEVIMVGDARFAERCRRELYEKRQDRALIIVSHSMDFIQDICDHSMVIQDGKAIICNSIQESIDIYTESVTLKKGGKYSSAEITDERYHDTLAIEDGQENINIDHSDITEENYRNPTSLRVHHSDIRRVLIVGSSLAESWAYAAPSLNETFETELYMFSNDLPEQPIYPIESYNFQILQIPMRSVLPDGTFAKLRQGDLKGHQDLLSYAKFITELHIRNGLKWNEKYNITTFVFSFILPQQNYSGKLLDRYSIENPVHFVEELNKFIADEIKKYNNVFFYDVNETLASIGRQYINEDMIASFNHGAIIGNFDFAFDQTRLEKVQPATDIYNTKTDFFIKSGWNELIALYRIVQQIDSVKMVVVDIDNTLWRGIIAEHTPSEMATTEGWPQAFWETLLLLKRRGIILAIISENEEAVVREAWPYIMGNIISLDDFTICRINGRQKSENMKEILQTTNIVPDSVIFIDDDPAQRSDIKSVYPCMRVLGGNPILWRHILLAAPETQIAKISNE